VEVPAASLDGLPEVEVPAASLDGLPEVEVPAPVDAS